MKPNKKNNNGYNWGVFKKGEVSAIILTITKEEADYLASLKPNLEVREILH